MAEGASRVRYKPMKWQESYKAGASALVRSFYENDCFDLTQQLAREEQRVLSAEDIAEWKSFLAPYATDQQLAPLDQLANAGTHVVVTGQQPCAMMGPLYVVYKALAARHWAAEVEKKTGKPCIPVFWVASDDHDLEEIRVASWLDQAMNLHSFDFSSIHKKNTRPAYNIPVERGSLEAAAIAFFNSIGDTEFADQIAPLFDPPEPGSELNFESFFVRIVVKLLLPLGIVPIVPRLGFLRRAQSKLLKHQRDHFHRTNKSIIEAGERIDEFGVDPPLHRNGDEFNFFLLHHGERCKVSRTPEGWKVIGSPETYLSDADFDKLLEKPELFSPNVIMRPLLQDMVLPTVAYIGGPSEVVYHGQIGHLYKEFSIPRPAVLPRPNVYLLDTRTEKALTRLGLTVDDLRGIREQDSLRELISAKLNNEGLSEALELLTEERNRIEQFQSRIKELFKDPAVAKAAEKYQDGSTGALERLEERIKAAAIRSDSDRESAAQKLQTMLFPGRIIQERSITIFAPLLINYGTSILGPLGEAIDYTMPGTQVISLRGLVTQ